MGMWSDSLKKGWLANLALVCLGLALAGSVHAQSQDSLRPVILIVGDSLSAGYGMPVDSTWVALLGRRLASEGYGHRVVNASASGETTGGARVRLGRALEVHKPRIVIVELGGNDALRGLPLRQIQENLADMIQRAKAANAEVLLLGMRIPPNYGAQYTDGFHALYSALAKQYDVTLVDFFMEGVALDETLMQEDGIHPSSQAQGRLLDNVWPALQRILKKQ
jgi:acyl-CoA thioesterase-1